MRCGRLSEQENFIAVELWECEDTYMPSNACQTVALGLKSHRSLMALILDANDIADVGGEAWLLYRTA